jgi:fumarate hydratase class II
MSNFRTEADSLGRVEVPAEKLWGAQTQRSLNLLRDDLGRAKDVADGNSFVN